MPTTTRTLMKGIPPRIRSPPRKGGGKKAAQLKSAPKNHKRHASESGDEESPNEDTSDSENPKLKQKGKKPAKWRCTGEFGEEEAEVEEEVEQVDDAVPEPEVEEVDDSASSGDKVSNIPNWSGMDLHNARRMDSMSINMAETSENSH